MNLLSDIASLAVVVVLLIEGVFGIIHQRPRLSTRRHLAILFSLYSLSRLLDLFAPTDSSLLPTFDPATLVFACTLLLLPVLIWLFTRTITVVGITKDVLQEQLVTALEHNGVPIEYRPPQLFLPRQGVYMQLSQNSFLDSTTVEVEPRSQYNLVQQLLQQHVINQAQQLAHISKRYYILLIIIGLFFLTVEIASFIR